MNPGQQFEFEWGTPGPAFPAQQRLLVGTRSIGVRFVRNRRARRYILRLSREGTARVTVPRGGSTEEAWRFARASVPWLERQLLRRAHERAHPGVWHIGTVILFRGEPARITVDGEPNRVCIGAEIIRVPAETTDFRPAVERHLWRLAVPELYARVVELATAHQVPIRRVSVRNQRSRWGSCSRKGTISLNWRLIQTPAFVRDYLILHELAHVRHMNHSLRFWSEVERLCPEFRKAEAWLKAHSRELLR